MEIIPPFNGGGIEAVTYEMAKALAKTGHRVILITTPGLIRENLVAVDNVEYLHCNLRDLPLTLLKISKEINVIHAIERANTFFGLPFKFKFPVLYHIHNQYPLISNDHKPWYSYMTDRLISEFGLKYSDHLLTCKEKLKAYIVSMGIDTKKITVLENAVDSDFFKPINNRNEVKDELLLTSESILLFLGRIDPMKGLEEVVRALPFVKEPIKLIIAGPVWNQDYYRKIRSLIKSLGLTKKVLFVGNLSYFALPKIYGIADVYICLARAASIPTTLLQAMASQLPVIVPNCPPYTQVVSKRNGYFVKSILDPEEVGSAITFLIRNQKLSQSIAIEARAYLKTEYSWSNYCKKLTSLYDRIIL